MFGKLREALPVVLMVLAIWLEFALPPSLSAQVLLGDQSIESSLDSNSRGQAEGFQTTAAITGTVSTLSVYIDARSSASNAAAGIYADNSGHPGNLLTQGNSTALTTGAWNTITVPPVNVTAGTRYWIAILGSANGTGTLYFRDRSSGSCASETSAQTTLTALPATWSKGTGYFDCPVSAYASAAVSSLPVLSVSPLNVAFTATTNGSTPAPVTVNVENSGSGTLTFSAASDSAWLAVTPTNGTAPQQLQISVNPAGLALGTYAGHVTITSSGTQGSPATVNVSLTIARPADWPMVDHDAARSGNAVDETTITPANVANLKLDWSVPVDGPATAQPLFASGVQINGQSHDVVIVATGGDSIYALDGSTGATLWKRNFGPQPTNCAIPGGFGISGAPLIDRATGRVYTVSDDGVFRTLSLVSGADVFAGLAVITNPRTNKVWGGLNKIGNSIYFATASDGCDTAPWRGQVYRIDVSGTPLLLNTFATVPSIAPPNGGGGIWGYGGVSSDVATGQMFGATGADSNELYTPYANRMIALDSNLNLLGSYGPPEPNNFPCGGAPCDLDFGATPLVFQPTGCPTMVVAGNKNGNLYLFRASDLAASTQPLQILTLNSTNDWLGSGGVGGVPAYWQAGNTVFISDVGPGATGVAGGIVALTVTASCTLQVAWSSTLGGLTQPDSTPTIANGVVFVGEGATGMLHAYDARGGSELWNSGSTPYSAAATYAAPSVAQGHLYVGSWSDFSGGGVVGAFSLNSPKPILSVSPTSISFTGTQGGTNPPLTPVSITNPGSGTLTFTTSSDASWLRVSPNSGTAPQTVQVGVDLSGLIANTYTGHITVTASGAQGSPIVITATLTVGAASPVLSVSPSTIAFAATQGGTNPSPATLSITNTGGGTLSFTAAIDSQWLTVSPASGTAPQNLQVSAISSNLAQGSYNGTVTVTAAGAQGSPASVPVSLSVSASSSGGTVLFGDQAIEAQQDSNARGTAEAFQTTGLATGTLSSIVVYVNGNSTATTWWVGLYDDNNGHPRNLLTQTSSTQMAAGTWNTLAVPSVNISSGAKYWIAVLGAGTGTPYFRDHKNGSCRSESSQQTTLTSLPATWTTGFPYADCPISAYGR